MSDIPIEGNPIAQNLEDAGCDSNFIECFQLQLTKEKTEEQLRLLSGQRTKLLHTIHENQKKLDCLDYLIYKIKRER